MFSAMQIILILLWVIGWGFWGATIGSLVAGGCTMNALVVGMIVGDVPTALIIGGTYELMNIGLNPLGGSSVPNYNIGSVVGTAFGAKVGLEMGMSIGIVVATLGTSLDVFTKALGSIFLNKAKASFAKYEFKKGYNWIHFGLVPRTLINSPVPIALLLIAGQGLVETINEAIPAWLLNGFKNAGNVLPCLGFAILLRSLNIKGNMQYLLIGFFCYAYLGVNALGTAIIGLALALIAFYQQNRLAAIDAKLGGDDDD